MKKFLVVLVVVFVFLLGAGCTKSSVTATPTLKSPLVTATVVKPTVTATVLKPTVTATDIREATVTPELIEESLVDYEPPVNAIPLIAFENTKGYFYALNEEGPYQVNYPYQSTLLITVGNAWIGEDATHITLSSDGTIGNIYADVCAEEDGCSVKVSYYKAGHVGVTIVFGGMEVPSQTLADAVNNMFKASNCGGSGCNTIYVYGANGNSLEFIKGIEASAVDKVLKAPEKPYIQVVIGDSGAPAGSKVVLDEVNKPVGQMYYLADRDVFVSVPEAGGTVIYCGAKATIDGKDYTAGTAIVFPGTASDGDTPEDLNQTIEIVTNDPNMIRVTMIYSGSFEDQVSKLKEDYPDWTWSK